MLDKWLELGEQPYREPDADWDAFVAAHPQGSLLQTTAWARLKNNFGWSSQRVWLRQDGRFVAGAQILFKPVALGLARVAYIPHGPLVNWQDSQQVAVLFNQIDLAIYERRAAFVKIEPLLWQTEMPPERWQAVCQEMGCQADTDTIQPPRTAVLDLRPSLDDILSSMKQKTRYSVVGIK